MGRKRSTKRPAEAPAPGRRTRPKTDPPPVSTSFPSSRLRVQPALPAPSEAQAAELAARVSAWFGQNARDLPWRTSPRDPYHSLVAEAMLQQTQVSRVVDKYRAFVERFPTARALAAADERDVLAMWSGLGYYRRARHLHAAAKRLAEAHAGEVPRDAAAIRALPGVGRYTAGALASIAMGLPEPIVDGNVARVLLRVHGVPASTADPAVQPWLWAHATAYVWAAASPGAANEGLMELGATVCTPPPSMPRCPACPLHDVCRARIEGRQLEIPRPKPAARQREAYCAVALVERGRGGGRGELLVEQRPSEGMWSNMWQAPTLESAEAMPARAALARAVGLPAATLRPDGEFAFSATHRRMTFAVYRAAAPRGYRPPRGKFVTRPELLKLALSSPQRRILLGEVEGGLFSGG
jgi:A/G-specific adenine glycosylase